MNWIHLMKVAFALGISVKILYTIFLNLLPKLIKGSDKFQGLKFLSSFRKYAEKDFLAKAAVWYLVPYVVALVAVFVTQIVHMHHVHGAIMLFKTFFVFCAICLGSEYIAGFFIAAVTLTAAKFYNSVIAPRKKKRMQKDLLGIIALGARNRGDNELAQLLEKESQE